MKTKLKNTFRIFTSGSLLFLALFLFACNQETAHEHDTYTCPMHPTVISDRPGSCPVCGMDLVRKARPGEEVKITEDLQRLLKSPNEIVVSNVNTLRGEYRSLPHTVEAQGVVTYDPQKINAISARIGGRLESVFVKYNLQRITKGEKIAEIYSPEMLTAQRELIFLQENDATNQNLINGAKTKLKQLGATDNQIATLIRTREPNATFAIYSAYEGYALLSEPQSSTSISKPQPSASMGAMGQPSAATSTATAKYDGTIVREGDYVSAGQTLFNVVDPSRMRIDIRLPGNGNTVKAGDTVMLRYNDERTARATIDLIEPYFDDEKEFQIARVYTTQTKSLQIGQIVRVTITAAGKEALWVPKASVFDLGSTDVVFVRERGVLRPRAVVTGITSDNMIEIKQGLASSDEIAANASFLVDSEGFTKLK